LQRIVKRILKVCRREAGEHCDALVVSRQSVDDTESGDMVEINEIKKQSVKYEKPIICIGD